MTITAVFRLQFVLMLTIWLGLAHGGPPVADGTSAPDLPPPVRRALDTAGIRPANVGIWVQPVDGGAPVLSLNPDRPMNPASVMKLVTTFAALERLGPAHTWTTTVAANGPIHGGVLDGDLFLVGGGDPLLSDERVWKLLRRVRALGIDTVRGDIVVDGSALRLPPHDPNAFDGRGLRPYNSAAHGLLLHFNTLQLTLLPAKSAGERVVVAANPPLQGIELDNRIATASGDCGVWYSALDARLETGPANPRLVLLGSLPASCGRRDWAVSPLSPEQFAVAAIAGLWAEGGGKIEGSVRPGKAPADAEPLLEETSPPLADALREMNKWSSNVIARQLLVALGAPGAAVEPAAIDAGARGASSAERVAPLPGTSDAEAVDPAKVDTGSPELTGPVETYEVPSDATAIEAHAIDVVAAGAEAARAQLAAAGIDVAGLVIENGSGLSRIESVSARMLGELLLAAWRRPYMPEFVASLPVAGVDGTARGRLGGSPASGHAHVKTGYLNGVRATAGYVLDRNGRRRAVAMLVNDPQAVDSRPAQDALLEWIWQGDAELVSPRVPDPQVDAGKQ